MSEMDIAVIGMSCRFPGASNLATFWNNLAAGIESIHHFTEEELRAAGVEPHLLQNPNYVRAKGILENIEDFDAAFFAIGPGEAELLDPQQRLFLEESWKAVEHAGYDSERFEGSIAVFAGAGPSAYLQQNLLPSIDSSEPAVKLQAIIGNDKDFLATRVSYKLNLRGPSLTVQTACSTALVAVHLACQCLLQGECDMALAGGATIDLPHHTGYLYQEGMIVSPDGHCRAFDAQARGTVGGSGVGVVILKRLADALADGDTIHAVIKGSAINNDGSLKVGYTAPSVAGQAEVIAEAQVVAGISAESITYIEAHGTGTTLGDPIEVRALTQAFRRDTRRSGFCALGSVKTNIGHLDSAAGIAGLIKTILALKHRQIPPSLHYNQPNPQIEFNSSPFYVNTRLTEWKSPGLPRRAGVSSFGIGGTNAHVILEEAPETIRTSASRPSQLILLSARTPAALQQVSINLAEYLRSYPETLADAVFTLQIGRRQLRHRRMLVCKSAGQAVSQLTEAPPAHTLSVETSQTTPGVAFLFPGQGSQYVNMGRELYTSEPVFRDQVDQCLQTLNALLNLDLYALLFPPPGQEEAAARQLQQTALTQPALFTIEYALARLWISWGIQPAAMIGHSSGEYIAACLAGVFSLEDALKLVVARGRLMQAIPSGAMLAVPLAEDELLPILGANLALAATNGPRMSVVSGMFDAIDDLERTLQARSIETIRLRTSHAFHSSMMEPVLKDFLPILQKVRFNPPENPWVSTVTGDWISQEQAMDPHYWLNNILLPVRFSEAIERLLNRGEYILLEVGPGRTLVSLARQHPACTPRQEVLSSLRHPQETQPDQQFLLTTLGRLWLAGVQPDWQTYYAFETRQHIPLPTYPFETRRYWIDPSKPKASPTAEKKADLADWIYLPSWKRLGPALPASPAPLGPWLILMDEAGLGEILLNALIQTGEHVTAAYTGRNFARLSSRSFRFDPLQPDHFHKLLTELHTSQDTPSHILNLMDFGAPGTSAFLEPSLPQSFTNLLYLAQAWGRLPAGSLPVELIHAANGLFSVYGDEPLQPEHSLAVGPLRVIPDEYPGIGCRIIDLPQPDRKHPIAELAHQLLAELYSVPSGASIALRSGQRWEQTFEPLHLQNTALAPPALRQRGVYWITGGLGGIGLSLATHLAQNYQARLLLTGRSPFPERAEWSAWLDTHSSEDPVSTKIRVLLELETAGAEILVQTADSADRSQAQAALALAQAHFGNLHGVIYAAGVPGGGLIHSKTIAAARNVLAPKLLGPQVLGNLLKGQTLDFIAYCSSLASQLGGMGQVDYVAANASLDAIVQQQRQAGLPAISINWDSWQEVGMAARSTLRYDLSQAITPKEGELIFERLLSIRQPQALVSTLPLNGRLLPLTGRTGGPRLGGAAAAPTVAEHASLPTASAAGLTSTAESSLATLWADLLRVEAIGLQDDFFDLGGDSLLAIRLMSQVQERFGQAIPVSALLENRTLEKFTRLLSRPKAVHPAQALIAIEPGGPGQPLFLLHPIGGNVLCYTELAREMAPDRPVYGLQAGGLPDPSADIPAMASHYLQEIVSIQPTGPYLLAGWSMGGMLAYEIACQIARRDQSIALLGLIDTPAPGSKSEPDTTPLLLVEFLRDLAGAAFMDDSTMTPANLANLSTAQQEQVVYALAQKLDLLPAGLDTQRFHALFDVFRCNALAMRHYTPGRYRGHLTLFQATEMAEGFDDSLPGWSNLIEGPLESVCIPGNHYTLLNTPHVQFLASVLKLNILKVLPDQQ